MMQPLQPALALLLGLSSLVSIAAVAADHGTDATAKTTDVVDFCGEGALTLTTEILTLPADQAAKLDDLLAQMVTAEGAAEANVLVVVIWGNSSKNFASQGAAQVAELLGYGE
jgi:hypothetical protein